jgi:hypothetical protein
LNDDVLSAAAWSNNYSALVRELRKGKEAGPIAFRLLDLRLVAGVQVQQRGLMVHVHDAYSMVFDSLNENNHAPTMTMIEDDLGGICADLMDRLAGYGGGRFTVAVSQWRFLY